jgi:hypothetical protein
MHEQLHNSKPHSSALLAHGMKAVTCCTPQIRKARETAITPSLLVRNLLLGCITLVLKSCDQKLVVKYNKRGLRALPIAPCARCSMTWRFASPTTATLTALHLNDRRRHHVRDLLHPSHYLRW